VEEEKDIDVRRDPMFLSTHKTVQALHRFKC